MDGIINLHDKKVIEGHLRGNTGLHIYSIGDLDDFYFPYTVWYGLKAGNFISAIALLYTAVNPPVLLALAPENELYQLNKLLKLILHLLPSKFYSHLTPGTEEILLENYKLDFHGDYCKMVLKENRLVEDTLLQTYQLTFYDLPKIRQLFHESYPDNSFDPRMLETGMYFGSDADGKLVSIAGVHVFSQKYKVAALGNITTHPECRGKGLGKLITSRVCKELEPHVDVIGLNVHTQNTAALKCYKDLGFEVIAPYREYMAELK
ncbi:MAG: GNAT family N-acetyltransferase [Ignavibacteriae bacterium]|nr:MAG: GNAT family N-acetyltransferase [Ignavibacteriota bacterium]